MHVNTFDRYVASASLVHRLDARVKVVMTALFILSNALLPDGAWWGFLAAWGVLAVVAWRANISLWTLSKRGFIVLPFTLAVITILFTLPGQTVAQWQLGGWELRVSDAGLMRFASIIVRSWLSLQMAIWLTMTTQIPDILHALRHLKVPALLVSIIAFMYRYLFVLADEAQRLLRARTSRSATLPGLKPGRSVWWRARVAGYMVGQLFIRSFERSERVYQAMLARGYRGELMTMTPHAMRRMDWLFVLGVSLLLALVQGIGRLT